MKNLSFLLSKAVALGRAQGAAPDSRELVLERLLRKRAAAHQAGLEAQERLLRNQIIWSLPMRATGCQSGPAGNCVPRTAESPAASARGCEADRIESERR